MEDGNSLFEIKVSVRSQGGPPPDRGSGWMQFRSLLHEEAEVICRAMQTVCRESNRCCSFGCKGDVGRDPHSMLEMYSDL
jgi:hypothetical protein